MNRYRMMSAPRWWGPKLRPRLIRRLRGSRRRRQLQEQRLLEIEVRGAEVVRDAIDAGHAVMITPNHATHADAFSIYEAADQVGSPFYLLTAWQVFFDKSWLGQWILQWHGCFSIDREATDLQAFRQAVSILQKERNPLVVFPEGEVYHSNERVRPFRDGAAVIALSSVKKAKRPVVCIPCGMVYRYVEDPTAELAELMDDLEREIFWRPKPEQPLAERIYRFAETLMVIKEMEFLGQAQTGPLPQRINQLATAILQGVENRHDAEPVTDQLPDRVKEMRRRAIDKIQDDSCDEETSKQMLVDLDDLFLAVQLFSYPGDYVSEQPTIERMAETLDKFEEDVLDRFSAKIRGARKCTVAFGEPITVERKGKSKDAARALTETLESRVQQIIDEVGATMPSLNS